MPLHIAMRKFLFFIAVGSSCAIAQTVQVGVLGGVMATDPDPYASGESKRYLVGPTIELRLLNRKIGIEFDAIYRRFGNSYSYSFGSITLPPDYQGPALPISASSRSRANSWEFPLLGKYYFRESRARWRPFLGTGFSLREQWETSTISSTYPGTQTPQTTTSSSTTGLDVGATVAAGLDFKTRHRLSWQPQVRYTRWSDHSTNGRSLNQLDFGLGIRF